MHVYFLLVFAITHCVLGFVWIKPHSVNRNGAHRLRIYSYQPISLEFTSVVAKDLTMEARNIVQRSRAGTMPAEASVQYFALMFCALQWVSARLTGNAYKTIFSLDPTGCQKRKHQRMMRNVLKSGDPWDPCYTRATDGRMSPEIAWRKLRLRGPFIAQVVKRKGFGSCWQCDDGTWISTKDLLKFTDASIRLIENLTEVSFNPFRHEVQVYDIDRL